MMLEIISSSEVTAIEFQLRDLFCPPTIVYTAVLGPEWLQDIILNSSWSSTQLLKSRIRNDHPAQKSHTYIVSVVLTPLKPMR